MEYPRPKTFTHHSTNRARRALTSFMPNAANHYATPPTSPGAYAYTEVAGHYYFASAACSRCRFQQYDCVIIRFVEYIRSTYEFFSRRQMTSTLCLSAVSPTMERLAAERPCTLS